AVTADGKTVVTAGDDLVIRTFDVRTGETRSVTRLEAPLASGTALSPDGRYLVGMVHAPDGGNGLGAWALPDGRRVARLDLRQPVEAISVAAGKARAAYIHGHYTAPPTPRRLCVWDFESGKPPRELREFTRKGNARFGEVRTCFSPDGARLLAHQDD